jgi:hypothetical protein
MERTARGGKEWEALVDHFLFRGMPFDRIILGFARWVRLTICVGL